MKPVPRVHRCIAALLLAPFGALAAAPFTFASYPLFLAPAIKPNVMIILDNSESMDATMAGKVINGDDPATRGNIARGILRGLLTSYRDSFNFGITSFRTTGTSLYNTHAYYVGDAVTMVYTIDCVNGISMTNGGRRCMANPDAGANGLPYVTYNQSGDDADINDVLYSYSTAAVMYGVGASGVSYYVRGAPRSAGTGWALSDFPVSGPFGNGAIPFSPTDAGWLPQAATMPRELFVRRGWGYGDYITGDGIVNEAVRADSSTHFAKLISLLGNETSGNTGEIKNNAFFTPITGSLATVRDNFSNGGSTPITQSCQRNFVMLATDGNPTGKTNGDQYDPSEWQSTYNATTSTWTFGQAQRDVFDQLTALRSTSVSGRPYDIQTYVVGMGDTLANAGSVAALNKMADLGGGYPTAFVGSSTESLQRAFQAIVGDIQAKTSAASSVAANTGSWKTGSALYQAKFNSADWSGNLLDYSVGSTGAIAAAATWDAGAQVRAQHWNTGRTILTYKPSAMARQHGIPFRWPASPATPNATELDINQSTALGQAPGGGGADGFGELRLRFLRGDASQEARSCVSPPCAAPQFRNRINSPLGDVINSSPYFVGPPSAGYYDDFEAARYSVFTDTYRNRTQVLYVGANDGMLHAINASNGNEMLAYVPSAVVADLPKLTDLAYVHRYFVDGSPGVGDVFYANAWHTLLVAGMRAGAKGLFALDVTDPSQFNEGNAANIVRWEFQDPDMGYVFGQPQLVKTNNGRWSVVVSGGYNAGNANGHAFLFVIDAENGTLVAKIDTGTGSAASPNGLSAAGAIDINGDGIADIAYAGDLNGNLWKFDLFSTTPGAWALSNAGVPLFMAGDGHAITGRPDVTKFVAGGFLVAFGSGRYVAPGDNTDLTTQRVYAVRDFGPAGTVALSSLLRQSIAGTANGIDGNVYRFSTHAVGPPKEFSITGDNAITKASFISDKRGWYVDLTDSGERVVADARFRGGRAIFTSMVPDVSSPCAYGGSGWVLEFDAMTGNRFDSATFDSNGDNLLTSSDYISSSGLASQAINTSGRRIGAIPAAPTFMGNRNPGGVSGLEDKFINTSDGSVVRVRETSGAGREGRVMWHEVR